MSLYFRFKDPSG